MPNTQKTIKLLKQIIADPNCSHMNFSNIKGYLGELIVRAKLEDEGCSVRQKGNQSGYDLEFDNIKIDVKTSSFKQEIKSLPPYWGWSLKSKSKKRLLRCTHFVCVALDKDYNIDSFYIIDVKNLNKFPSGSGFKRFSTEKGFWVSSNKLPFKIREDIKYFTNCIKRSHNLLKKGIVIKIKISDNMGNVLK